MARSLMLFGISDRSQSVMDFKDELAQCRAGKCDRGIGKHAPAGITSVIGIRCFTKSKAGAIKLNEAVRQLMLDGLEFADHVTELTPDLGVLKRQIEGALSGPFSTRRGGQTRDRSCVGK
ncbi:hypothetical protein GCM10007897_40750 [Sphingobium jiangsuense]|nr:hypothetical protein GCM10007897_40750 [Sphingobium jiangsuense]